HHSLSEPNQPLRYFTLPQHCTLWTGGESALVTIRIWLRSVSRVGQPPRDSALSHPVSGLPASPSANRRILASFRDPRKAASVGPRLPPAQLLSGSKTPPSVGIHMVLHGEVLYLQYRQPY